MVYDGRQVVTAAPQQQLTIGLCHITTHLWWTQQSRGLPLCIICWLPVLPTVHTFLVLYLAKLSLTTTKQCWW